MSVVAHHALRGFASLLAIAAAANATLAAAQAPATPQAQAATPATQPADPAQSDAIEDIIVTAQKRAQNIQEVPIAITALTSAAIEAARIEDSKDLQFNAPNVLFSANRNWTIRGVGSQSYGGSNDTNIGQLINGVFLQNGSTFGEFFDLERIEVLRGPQGTLFGRNTTGGLINFITRKPSKEFEGYASLQIESYSGFRGEAAINFPVVNGIYQRFSANFVSRDGYTQNLYDNSRIDGRNQYTIRSSTRFEPTDSTTADLVLIWFAEDSNRAGAVKTLCTPDATFGCSPLSVSTQFPTVNFPIDNIFLRGVVRAGTFNANPSDLRTVNIDVNPTVHARDFLGTLEINQQIGSTLTLTSVTGYRDGNSNSLRDFDQGSRPNAFNPGTYGSLTVPDSGSGNGVLTYLLAGQPITTTEYRTTQTAANTVEQFSQELRLASDFSGKFNFVFGGYYLDAKNSGNVTTYMPAALTRGFIASGNTPSASVESLAAFGEIYYDITPNLSFLAGLRYTSDDKKIQTASGTFVLGKYFFGNENFSATTGRASIDWNPEIGFTDDSHLYFTFSRGFKSGGFNPGNIGVPTFDSEYINAYEIGSKNILLDNHMSLNMALFHYDYSNLILGNIVGTLATNVNVPTSNVDGFELETVWTPLEGLRFEASLGLLNARITSDFMSSDPTRGGAFFQLNGNKMPNAPDSTLKLAAEYLWDVGSDWTIRPRIDFYTQSGFYSREFNVPADKVGSWQQLDLSIQVARGKQDWAATIFVKNLTDDNGITFLETNSNLVGSFRSAFLLDPRVFGVSLRVGFN